MNGHRERPIEAFGGTYDWILAGSSTVHVCARCEDFDDGALEQHLGVLRETRPHWSDLEAHKKHTFEEGVYFQCRASRKRDRLRNDHSGRFRTWLDAPTNDTVFWIHGKPGSGKSTLMNHLIERLRHQDVAHEKLSAPIIIAHFFWIAGGTLQRSLIGLMRHLLYQILEAQRRLIAKLFGKPMPAICQHQRSWSRHDLRCALLELLQQCSPNVRFVLLIDGLDEAIGDAQDLADFLGELGSYPVTKVCVASRVNNLFFRVYGQDKSLCLALQDVNDVDIDIFVRSRLDEAKAPVHLSLSQLEVEAISTNIRECAEGVFLWVQLAVDDVRKGIANGESALELEERVNRLPPELDDFIQRIFDSIDEQHKKYAARLLISCLRLEHFRPLWTLSIQEEFRAEDFALRAHTARLSKRELYLQKRKAVGLVHAWGKGLLIANAPDEEMPDAELLCSNSDIEDLWADFNQLGETTVQFYHRSVFDFFERKREDGSLAKIAGQDYKPDLTVCRTMLRVLKNCHSSLELECRENEFPANVVSTFGRHAWRLEADLLSSSGAHGSPTCSSTCVRDVARLFEELHHVAQALVQDRNWIFAFADNQWQYICRIVLDGLSPDLLAPRSYGGVVMLSILSQCSQSFFALLDLVSEQEIRDLVNVWLLCALVPTHDPSFAVDVKIIEKLFELGADVNASIASDESWHWSMWQRLLMLAFSYGDIEQLFLNHVDILLSYGADPDIDVRLWDEYQKGRLRKDFQSKSNGSICAVDLFDPALQIRTEWQGSFEFKMRLDFYQQVQDRLKAASKAKAKAEQEAKNAAGPSRPARKKRKRM